MTDPKAEANAANAAADTAAIETLMDGNIASGDIVRSLELVYEAPNGEELRADVLVIVNDKPLADIADEAVKAEMARRGIPLR